MKKQLIIAFIAMTVLAFASKAQNVPNGGFESWTTDTISDPIAWGTLNWLHMYGMPITCIKTTDAHSGNYALKVETLLDAGDTVDGFAFTGVWPLMANPIFGFKDTSRPLSLTGYYKYSSQLGDSCSVIAYFTKWNTALQKQDSIGGGSFNGKAANTYTHFQVPVHYTSAQKPDSATVIILASASSSQDNRGLPGDTLYVDDLSFQFINGIADVAAQYTPVTVYPNPSTGKVIINGLPNQNIEIMIYDISGKEVYKSIMAAKDHELVLNITNLRTGIYFYTATAHSFKSSGKFELTE